MESRNMATEKQKRIIKIKIALTEAEHTELERKKTRPQLARWIREAALDEKDNVKRTASKEGVGLSPEVARIFSGIGNNLNQIAKQMNSASKIGVLNRMDLIRALTEISATERSLNLLRQFLIEQEQKVRKPKS